MSLLRCWSVRNVLDLYVDGRLTERAAARVAAHLEECANCRAEADALKPVSADLAEKVEVPEGLAEAILEKLGTEERPAPAPALRELISLEPAQALALVYLTALIGGHALPGVPSQAYAQEQVETEAR